MNRIGTIQFLCFIFLWTTLVYDTIARWSWNPQGWSRSELHTLDFAGGTVVHISSGAAATAIATYFGLKLWIWKSYTHSGPDAINEVIKAHMPSWKPQNVSYVLLGTIILWFGWFGFNGGSELAANPRAALACVSTQMAPCFGGITSLILHWFLYAGPIKACKEPRHIRPDASQAFCGGVVIALVAITPAAGYVCISPGHIFLTKLSRSQSNMLLYSACFLRYFLNLRRRC
jgi:Amt family ammonium transporter